MNPAQLPAVVGDDQPNAQSPFRRYGWLLGVMAVLLILMCAGIGMMEAAGGGPSILARLRSSAGLDAPAPTFIPSHSDAAAPASTPTATVVSSETPPPLDTPTVTASSLPAVAVTCKCQGPNYVCSDGGVTRNSPRCAPQATVACSCNGHNWVCSDGTRSKNDIRCGLVCQCQGNDLYCNDGTIGIYNPECACKCDCTTMICNDGGTEPNAAFCGGGKKKK
jgi:hypothetical protein